MIMALASTTAANQSLDGLTSPTNLLAYVSLHTASPSTNGANENAATGGYARQAATWNAAASGAKTNSSALTFSTAGTTAVTHVGTFSAVTAGTYGIGAPLSSPVTATSITFAAGSISFGSA